MSPAAVTVDAGRLLADLLGIPSPTGAVDAAAAMLARRLDELGYMVEQDAAGNLLGTWGEGPTEVMLVGHLDTVPGEIAVRREGRLLHGRGAVDAKGPLVAAIAAVASQPRSGRCRFTVVAVPDEEGDSHGAGLLASRPAPDHLVILEPSGWDAVTIGYRGCIRASLELRQQVAHGAGGLPSAPDRMVAALRRLQDEATRRNHGRRTFESLDVRLVSTGSESDGLQESCGASIVLRLPPGLGADEATALLEAAAPGATLSIQYRCEAVRAAKGSALVRSFVTAIRSTAGRPRYKVKTGTADLNVLVPAWGCPALAYGPGDSRLDHTPHEAIDLDELDRGVAVLSSALGAL